MRLTKRDSLERMHAVVDMTLTFMSYLVQALIFVVKNQLLLRASKASPEDPD